jgi:hypothetical protein
MSLAAMVGKLLLLILRCIDLISFGKTPKKACGDMIRCSWEMREVSANLLDDYVQRNNIQIDTSGTIGWCSTNLWS